jgi:hypothetical protein
LILLPTPWLFNEKHATAVFYYLLSKYLFEVSLCNNANLQLRPANVAGWCGW